MNEAQILRIDRNSYLYHHMDVAINMKEASDSKQFEDLFNQHYDALVHYAYTMLKEMEEAEDVVQSVFLDFWNDRKKINFSDQPRAYLYKGVYFKCLNKLKRQKVIAKFESSRDEQFDHDAQSKLEATELQTKINEAIASLPEQCRKIFSLSRFELMKYHEIADELAISPKTVENQMGKALRIMRSALSDFLYFIILILNLS